MVQACFPANQVNFSKTTEEDSRSSELTKTQKHFSSTEMALVKGRSYCGNSYFCRHRVSELCPLLNTAAISITLPWKIPLWGKSWSSPKPETTSRNSELNQTDPKLLRGLRSICQRRILNYKKLSSKLRAAINHLLGKVSM